MHLNNPKIKTLKFRNKITNEHATGPRTRTGKDIAKYSALKHGLNSVEGLELRRLMTLQKRFVNALLAQAGKYDNKDE